MSERFRLRFEDAGLEEMMEEELPEVETEVTDGVTEKFNGIELVEGERPPEQKGRTFAGEIRTLDGDIAGDEFAQDAMNYQILMGKIETLLDKLELDA